MEKGPCSQTKSRGIHLYSTSFNYRIRYSFGALYGGIDCGIAKFSTQIGRQLLPTEEEEFCRKFGITGETKKEMKK